jgi:hypothetical protein
MSVFYWLHVSGWPMDDHAKTSNQLRAESTSQATRLREQIWASKEIAELSQKHLREMQKMPREFDNRNSKRAACGLPN